jgi:RNA polymerase sigma-70 factor (ECF subfamily)
MSDQDQNIIETLYENNFERIYRFFYYKLLSKEAAQDLTSETFLTFIEHINKNKPIDNFTNYLYGIARNVFLKFLKNKYQQDLTEQFNEESFAEHVELFINELDSVPTIEEKAQIYIQKLPEKQKLILHARLIEKKTLEEICTLFGKGMNYVKTTQKRGLKNLRELAANSVHQK